MRTGRYGDTLRAAHVVGHPIEKQPSPRSRDQDMPQRAAAAIIQEGPILSFPPLEVARASKGPCTIR